MNLRRSFTTFSRDKFLLWVTITTSLVVLLTWILPLWQLPRLVDPGELIPLHYNVYVGVDFFGTRKLVYFFPIFASVVLFLNTILAITEHKRHELLARMLVGSALAVNLVVLAGLLFTLALNISYA